MNKTIKLYDFTPYETGFTGKVVSCERLDGSHVLVVLDKTLFFPEEGGQSPDKGNIDGFNVKNVQIKNDIISHTIECDTEHFVIDKGVYGNIDWDYRFSNMQNHSAEHIFSGLVNRKYGFNNCGFHLSDNIVTMDFDGPLSIQDIEELEIEVNNAIYKNVETKTGYPEADELKKLEYRSKIDLESGVRIVEIGSYDKCACCAPHVSKTGEIGIFKVQSVQSYKGGVRISYLAGRRALNAYINDFKLVESLGTKLSANRDNLEQFVDNLKSNNEKLKLDVTKANTFRLEIEIDRQKN
ncbi:MAG: alanyl-tRNA editing protein, partial [Christensenellaceae bacterium]|nr:alanyl-tRNA editing protein [Christensenellaceae bacterium]